jgi:hypothetical protein
MNTFKLAALATLMLGGAAVAADDQQPVERDMRMQIVVAGDAGDGTTINWTSNDPDLDLHNMQVGESRSIVDDSGRSVLVTKLQDGLKFDVDGESVVVPDMGNHGTSVAFVAADGVPGIEHDFDVQVLGSGRAMASPVADGIMIITREPLDAATQESIRAVLLSAGNDDEVTFIADNGSESDGKVHVIRRTVEITQ